MADSKRTKLKPTWLILFDDVLISTRKDKSWPLEFVFVAADEPPVMVDHHSCVRLYTPEEEMVIRMETEKEIDFVKQLKLTLVQAHEFSSRSLYRFANGRSYEGEWFAGKFHGNGTLTTPENIRYSGYWNSKFGAAVGTIRNGNGNNNIVANSSSGGPSSSGVDETEVNAWRVADNNVVDLFTNDEDGVGCLAVDMAFRDWGLLQSGQTVMRKQEGEVILEKGQLSNCVYQVNNDSKRKKDCVWVCVCVCVCVVVWLCVCV
jgi:hypothetical protein